MYKALLSNKATKQLDKIPKTIYLKIYDRIKSLTNNPRPQGCVKLTDKESYRIRIGDFRVLYEINEKDKVVEIYDILDRKEAYKKR